MTAQQSALVESVRKEVADDLAKRGYLTSEELKEILNDYSVALRPNNADKYLPMQIEYIKLHDDRHNEQKNKYLALLGRVNAVGYEVPALKKSADLVKKTG